MSEVVARAAHRAIAPGFVVVAATFVGVLDAAHEEWGRRTRIGDVLDVDGRAMVVAGIEESLDADLVGDVQAGEVRVRKVACAEDALTARATRFYHRSIEEPAGQVPTWAWLRSLAARSRWAVWELLVIRGNDWASRRAAADLLMGSPLRPRPGAIRPFLSTRLCKLLRGLGLDLVVDEPEVYVQVPSDSDTRREAPRVTTAATFDDAGAIVRDGLHCERTFGPVRNYECSCGKYRGYQHLGLVCEKCGVEVTSNEARFWRIGRIDLSQPYDSPLFDDIRLNVLPVVPPGLRDAEVDQLYLDVFAADAAGGDATDAVEALCVGAERSLANQCDALWADEFFLRPADFTGFAHLTVAEVDATHCLLPVDMARALFRHHIVAHMFEGDPHALGRAEQDIYNPPDGPPRNIYYTGRSVVEAVVADQFVMLAVGETTVLRRVRLWDEVAIGVDAATVATLPEVGATVHVPLFAESIIELQREPEPAQTGGWLSAATYADSFVEAAADAAVAQARDNLADPLIAAAFGKMPAPLDPDEVAAFYAAEAARRAGSTE